MVRIDKELWREIELVLEMKGKPTHGGKKLALKISPKNDQFNTIWWAKVAAAGFEQEIVVNHYFDMFVLNSVLAYQLLCHF